MGRARIEREKNVVRFKKQELVSWQVAKWVYTGMIVGQRCRHFAQLALVDLISKREQLGCMCLQPISLHGILVSTFYSPGCARNVILQL